ncbi:MAG: UDP-glucose 4-epimerase GalE [Candidatus Marinimicrobia bacterium]|jgi:UDP-glucose 4-epimerase|nr:UDP-glucose 4-epimerase GalE [Candidatus Neomarinimicrobiota bacterium]MDP6593196.1 UDP-glucose 4-epimerase GalE [Candidatus Neomarinimicrobiota bacterium]MDP6835999.1 UDP-glucose 4-epimerase GalE [Candidatus Neomarinimicrobiota bacterium]|tara:strand:+ start:1266 stop:2246 length:981 start_codon:yes stop_codon:yes gene_type:complete
MKILVTGGAGYIGSHVVLDLIDAGYEVAVLDDLSSGWAENVDSRASFIKGSTHESDLLQEALSDGVEAVIHLAAFKAAGESMKKPEKYTHNNIDGTLNLLNAMLDCGVNKFVFSSTAAVYGDPQYLPMDEEHPVKPANYYGFTKLMIEECLDWYGKLRGLRFAALRYFNAAGYDPEGRVRGLEKNPANLLPVVMETAAGIRQEMAVFGNDYETSDGTGVRDYIHVTDLAEAHVRALEHLDENSSLTVNLAAGESFSVLDVINKAREITGEEIAFCVMDRRLGDPAELIATSKRAADLLGWRPKRSDLDTILNTMWQVYKPEEKLVS